MVFGQPAVVAFFTVSGFVLLRPFVSAWAASTPAPRARFAWRRTVRIVPAYWVVLTAAGIAGTAALVLTDHGWRHYLFTQIYSGPADPILIGGLPQAWTLCVEVTFYALLSARWRSSPPAGPSGPRRPGSGLSSGTHRCARRRRDRLDDDRRTRGSRAGRNHRDPARHCALVRSRHDPCTGQRPCGTRVSLPRPLRAVRDHPVASWLVGAVLLVAMYMIRVHPPPATRS